MTLGEITSHEDNTIMPQKVVARTEMTDVKCLAGSKCSANVSEDDLILVNLQ